MSELQRHWFGLPVPEGFKPVRAWRARAIIRLDIRRRPVKVRGKTRMDVKSQTVIEMVGDRSQYRGPAIEEPEAKAFFKWVDRTALPKLRKHADAVGLAPDDDREIAIDDGVYHIRANPRRSYGYLYIVAWEG